MITLVTLFSLFSIPFSVSGATGLSNMQNTNTTTSSISVSVDYSNAAFGDYIELEYRESGESYSLENTHMGIDGSGTVNDVVTGLDSNTEYDFKYTAYDSLDTYLSGITRSYSTNTEFIPPSIEFNETTNKSSTSIDVHYDIELGEVSEVDIYMQYQNINNDINTTSTVSISENKTHKFSLTNLYAGEYLDVVGYLESTEYDTETDEKRIWTTEGTAPDTDYYATQIANTTSSITLEYDYTVEDYRFVTLSLTDGATYYNEYKAYDDGTFNYTISDLVINSTYSFKPQLNYSNGTAAGGLFSFSTKSDIPINTIEISFWKETYGTAYINETVNMNGLYAVSSQIQISEDGTNFYSQSSYRHDYFTDQTQIYIIDMVGTPLKSDTKYYVKSLIIGYRTVADYENNTVYDNIESETIEFTTSAQAGLNIVSATATETSITVTYDIVINSTLGYSRFNRSLKNLDSGNFTDIEYVNITSNGRYVKTWNNLDRDTHYGISFISEDVDKYGTGQNTDLYTDATTAGEFANIWGEIGVITIVIISFIAFIILYFTGDGLIFSFVLTILTFVGWFMELISFVYVLFAFMFIIVYFMLMNGYNNGGYV